MTTPEAALATRHVKGQTWDSGSPEAVDGFITWCKGCGQRPWPCDTRKALDLLEAALTPLAPEVPPRSHDALYGQFGLIFVWAALNWSIWPNESPYR